MRVFAALPWRAGGSRGPLTDLPAAPNLQRPGLGAGGGSAGARPGQATPARGPEGVAGVGRGVFGLLAAFLREA